MGNDLELPEVDLHDPILWQGVVSQLQHENEQLRLYILKLRTAKFGPVAAITSGNVKKFLVSNYMVIGAVGTLLFIVLSLVETIRGIASTHS